MSADNKLVNDSGWAATILSLITWAGNQLLDMDINNLLTTAISFAAFVFWLLKIFNEAKQTRRLKRMEETDSEIIALLKANESLREQFLRQSQNPQEQK